LEFVDCPTCKRRNRCDGDGEYLQCDGCKKYVCLVCKQVENTEQKVSKHLLKVHAGKR
jgi:hypothetical protein